MPVSDEQDSLASDMSTKDSTLNFQRLRGSSEDIEEGETLDTFDRWISYLNKFMKKNRIYPFVNY